MRTLIRSFLEWWKEFWRGIEGPELEPRFWHSHYLSHRATHHVLARLGHHLNGVVIDIGAGTGTGAAYLDHGYTDYFPTDLSSGRDPNDRHISLKSVRVMQNCSAYDLPFSDSSFGGAMMLMVLEHLENPKIALSEAFRTLAPGGKFLASTPFAFPVHGAPYDFRRWTPAGLESEFRAVGFDIEECVACGGLFSSLALNWNLGWRYSVVESGRLTSLLVTLGLPLCLIVQGTINLLALILDRLDSRRVLPLAIVILARKPEEAL